MNGLQAATINKHVMQYVGASADKLALAVNVGHSEWLRLWERTKDGRKGKVNIYILVLLDLAIYSTTLKFESIQAIVAAIQRLLSSKLQFIVGEI